MPTTRTDGRLHVAHLYPSLLNVAGDGGNLMALQQRSAWRGIEVAAEAINAGDSPDFTTFDIVLFHGGQDVEMGIVAKDLGTKAASLQRAAREGVVIFAVCAGLQLLGHVYRPARGEPIPGIGILDLETNAGNERFMQHAACVVTLGDETDVVVGFENHSGLTTLGPDAQPFGRVIAGAGNNGRDRTEGARWENVFATYLHGPVLPKNPWLADRLIAIALRRTASQAVDLAPLPDELEQRAHSVALDKAIRNRGRRTALTPARLSAAHR
jgi:lipid II isoglutaminyl synthase (glutamine-hydrolysing)